MTNSVHIDYASMTINDKNPFKRLLQNRRLEHSLKRLRYQDLNNTCILDFGSGDGELCLRINKHCDNVDIICYEPSEMLKRQAEKKLSALDNIKILSSITGIENVSVDYIFCLEVFEHLTQETMEKAFDTFKRIAKSGATIIIGVPNEIFFAALLKGILRVKRRYGSEDALFKNIFRAALGIPPKERPLKEFDGLPYIIRHMGFDHRKFKQLLKKYFHIEKIYGSPFTHLPVLFNMEIYFICKHQP